MLVGAAALGLIPESGPQLIVVMLFAAGSVPLSILLANSIVQDGHGMLPLLAHSWRDFLKVKAINLVAGLAGRRCLASRRKLSGEEMERPPVTFGPVASRRLGQSLGVNNIPPKHCTYACVYCQIGRTPKMAVERRAFFPPEVIADAVRRRLDECEHTGVRVDYLTVVPDGEPTLDLNLGRLITELRELSDLPLQ